LGPLTDAGCLFNLKNPKHRHAGGTGGSQAGRLRSSLGRKAKGKKYICKFHPAPRSIERSVDFEWQISGATPVICGKTFTINPAAFSRPADG